jgi:hypothetical protein
MTKIEKICERIDWLFSYPSIIKAPSKLQKIQNVLRKLKKFLKKKKLQKSFKKIKKTLKIKA